MENIQETSFKVRSNPYEIVNLSKQYPYGLYSKRKYYYYPPDPRSVQQTAFIDRPYYYVGHTCPYYASVYRTNDYPVTDVVEGFGSNDDWMFYILCLVFLVFFLSCFTK